MLPNIKPKLLPITIGCDPEFALFDKQTKSYVSAHDLIPGTKAQPHKVDGGAIQVDGVMVEFNIDPAKTADEFADNIEKVMTALRKYLPADRYVFMFDPIVVYDRAYFEGLPDSVKELGCSPDFNAWKGGGINQSPVPVPFLPTMRTCSGHIHIGWTDGADTTDPSHLWDCRTIIRLLDCALLHHLDDADPDRIRRMMYGKAGAFRPKPYGVEWRVPSNFWLHSRTSRMGMFLKVKEIMLKSVMIGSKLTENLQPMHLPFIHSFMKVKQYDTGRVPVGARVAPTSGKVNYDLNLDIPYDIGGKYRSPPNEGKGLKDFVLL